MHRTMTSGQLSISPAYLRDVARLIEVARGHDGATAVDIETWKDSWMLKVWESGNPYEDEPDYLYFIDGDGDIQGGMQLMDVPTMLLYVPLTDGSYFSLDEEISLYRRPFEGSSAEFNAMYPNG